MKNREWGMNRWGSSKAGEEERTNYETDFKSFFSPGAKWKGRNDSRLGCYIVFICWFL